MLIKEVMSENIHYIQVPGNRLNALALMREKNVSGLPVVKSGTKKLVGIVTRSDLVTIPISFFVPFFTTGNPDTFFCLIASRAL